MAGLVMMSVAGCGESERKPRFANLEDEAFLRGEQLTRIETDSDLLVVKADLFLDGQLVAVDELAPFELRWDTREFAERKHRLRLRVHLEDGKILEEDLDITIDNTPPTLGALPTRLDYGVNVAVDAQDNFGIARVEVESRPLFEPLVLLGGTLRFPWPGGCGEISATVRAFDRAGGMAERVSLVTSRDGRDADCDGFLSKAGNFGDDCNDEASWVHPGAAEPPEGFDLNCDGQVASLAGVDSDGDGVASFADGGDDCDDTSPAVHGRALQLASRRLTRGGQPLEWSPGEAVLASSGPAWTLWVNRAGTVEQVSPGADEEVVVDEIATGANPGSVGGGSSVIAFGRGNDVVVLRRQGAIWEPAGVIAAGGPVGKVVVDGAPFLHVLYQAGTQVWIAAENGSSGWSSKLIIDAGAPLVEVPQLWVAPAGVAVLFRTAGNAWTATGAVGLVGRPKVLGPSGAALTAAALYTNLATAVAFESGGGGAVEVVLDLGGAEPTVRRLNFSQRVTGLHIEYPYLFVQLDDTALHMLALTPSPRTVGVLPSVRAFDASFGETFAGNGFVHHETAGTVMPAFELAGDLRDSNCDGRDL